MLITVCSEHLLHPLTPHLRLHEEYDGWTMCLNHIRQTLSSRRVTAFQAELGVDQSLYERDFKDARNAYTEYGDICSLKRQIKAAFHLYEVTKFKDDCWILNKIEAILNKSINKTRDVLKKKKKKERWIFQSPRCTLSTKSSVERSCPLLRYIDNVKRFCKELIPSL
ncbi:unnamed protein product [Cuscuta europaea]|uniref:Uncharacterized protein n=1 Tax=Cuscuta europaea TaxID=41803 RepID=A0A9P1E6U1_CUSEU|nr:unnamed protein product [Cuscuta europaea]